MSHDRSVEDPLIMFESHKIDIQYICEPFGGYGKSASFGSVCKLRSLKTLFTVPSTLDQGLLRSAPVTLQISSINDLYEIVTVSTLLYRAADFILTSW